MCDTRKEAPIAYRPSLCRTLTISTAGIAFVLLLGRPIELALGQSPAAGAQQTPSVIPEIEADADPTGQIATYQPEGTPSALK